MAPDNLAILVYSTAPNELVAEKIAKSLVKSNLAACINIIPQMTSIYRWEEKIERASECALLIKTTTNHYPAIEKSITEQHPYDCPAIITLPVSNGYPPFLQWIKNETQLDASDSTKS